MPRVKATPKKRVAKSRLPRPKKPVTKAREKMQEPLPAERPATAKLQNHIQASLIPGWNGGRRRAVTELSRNKLTPNKRMNKKAEPARYGTRAGRGGPESDFAAPITRDQPMAATDSRQYLINTKNNKVPDEFGVTSGRTMPRQQLTSARGGKYSGRTGPM